MTFYVLFNTPYKLFSFIVVYPFLIWGRCLLEFHFQVACFWNRL